MNLRQLALGICLVGSLGTVIVTAAQRTNSPQRVEFLPDGNLQVGVPGELLPEPIAVRTAPGGEIRFFSPDLGRIEESGAAEAVVTADAQGIARVHVRLGANLGRYTVVAGPALGDGAQAVFTFRAIEPAAMRVRAERIARGRTTAGGAR